MTHHQELTDEEYSFIKGGIVHRVLVQTGVADSGPSGIRTRIIALILVTMAPLIALAAVQDVAVGSRVQIPLLYAIADITRFLIVGPALIALEVVIEPWLVQVVQYTRDHLIPGDQRDNYKALIARAVRLRDSYIAEILLLVGAFALQFSDPSIVINQTATTWHLIPGTDQLTYAGYYSTYFAKPLIRFLMLRWMWRYVIWSLLLCRLSGLNLKVTPTHPDRHGGLWFISVGHTKFSALAFAFALQSAGILGERIVFGGSSLMACKYEILGIVVLALVVFLTPLLAFTGTLLNAKRVGLFELGKFADVYTTAFRAKWLSTTPNPKELLGSPDIQSLADLSAAYDIVSDMRPCLIGKESIIMFGIATLAPFAPLLLTVYPFDVLINHLVKSIM